ncbi:MAG: GTPase [Phycisphaerales bacterium]|nr:GTPase [Phycisphaerales bacterium]
MPGHATIAACATGGTGGAAARALIRLSGPACAEVEKALIERPPSARSPLAARLRLTDDLRVPCLAWSAKGPRTYTGEDTLELLIAGNPHLVRRVLDRLCAHGATMAEPGEFSARAYLNGKLTLDQAEGVAAMVAAERTEQLSAAAAVMSGAAGAVYRHWAEEVAALLALVEAGIDFSDQEGVVAIEPRVLRERTARLIAALRAHLGGETGREQRTSRPKVALIGAPNAGKSTLFNALLGRERAVSGPVAGTTRDVLVEPLTLSAPGREPMVVDLMDLPGLEAAAGGTGALAQRAAHEALALATVRVHCCERGPFADVPNPSAARDVRVRTKADRPGWVEGAEVAVCSLTGAGLEQLRRLIANAARGAGDHGAGAIVTRHAQALARAAAALESVNADGAAELTAHHLRAALDALGEVSGAIPPDEVIGRVFASFCIGK